MGVGLMPSAPVEETAVALSFTGGKDDGRDGLSELVLVGTAALGAAA